MNYLNKVKIKRYLPFFLGFFLSFCLINYKIFVLDLLLNTNYESWDYIRPAKIFYETNSFSSLFESLDARLPTYPILISYLFNFFGYENFISILFFQSFLYGLIVHISIKIKNIFTKKYFWISLLIILLNLNLLLSSTIILPDFLLTFFLTNGIYFYLLFFKNKSKYFYLLIGNIFFSLTFITKPVAILLPFFLFLSLIIFCIYNYKKTLYKKILISLSPLLIIYIVASPLYLYHYQKSGVASISYQKGGHLLFGIYPCLSQKWGCGTGNILASENAIKISQEISVKFFKKEYGLNKVDLEYIKNVNMTSSDRLKISKLHEDAFYKVINEIKTTQIIQSAFFSYMKLMLHTSLISFIDFYNINYEEYKIPDNFNKITFIWLIGQIVLIISRFFQIYGTVCYLKSNKKNIFSIIFLLLICIAFLIPALSIGNYRYRLPIEMILSLLTILGVRKFIKNNL